MGKVYEQLNDALMEFIGRQHVFFVGAARLACEGRRHDGGREDDRHDRQAG